MVLIYISGILRRIPGFFAFSCVDFFSYLMRNFPVQDKFQLNNSGVATVIGTVIAVLSYLKKKDE